MPDGFSFDAPGLNLQQKLAVAAVKACPVCCGSGGGSGESSGGGPTCCGGCNYGLVVDDPWPTPLTFTIETGCQGVASCELYGGLIGECPDISVSDTSIQWVGYCSGEIIPGEPDFFSLIDCSNGVGASLPSNISWDLMAIVYCKRCGPTGTRFFAEWIYQTFMAGEWKYTYGTSPLIVESCRPLMFAHYSSTIVCYNAPPNEDCCEPLTIGYTSCGDWTRGTNCIDSTVYIDISE